MRSAFYPLCERFLFYAYFSPVIYSLLKLYARIAIKIYCTRILIHPPHVLKIKGPVLFAANHPNSFLDGMLLTTLLDAPLYSLARGDVFKNHRINKLLRWLQLLPVYRTSEGVENLGYNYTTFAACRETFEKNSTVLIFSEGRCENEWHLRPLKKGTARLAISSWKQGIPLTVIPTAFNYSSFKKFGKEVHLFFGNAIEKDSALMQENEGKQLLHFNEQLQAQLAKMVYEIDPEDEKRIRSIFSITKTSSFYFLLLPAIIGWMVHAPLFYSCKAFAQHFIRTGHYDSVMTSVLLLLYPLYLLASIYVASCFFSWWSLWLLIIMPFTAWACTQVKYQLDI